MYEMYGSVMILNPKTSKNELDEVICKIKNEIQNLGGNFKVWQNYGIKKLAYTVKNENEGLYIILYYDMKPEFIEQLETKIKEIKELLKSITVLENEDTIEVNNKEIREKIYKSSYSNLIKSFAIEILNNIETNDFDEFSNYMFTYEDIIDTALNLIEDDVLWETFDNEMAGYLREKIRR